MVLSWRYERWTDQDAIICRFDDTFSWGVCKYCRFPWKETYMVDPEPVMSMAQGVAMPGGIMARLDLFLIAFWIVGVFCVFSGYLFYGNESIKHAFSKGRIVGLSLSYGGIYVISPWIMTTFATWIRRYFFVFIYGNLVIGLFFPLILFLMWRKEQKDEKI